MSWKAPCWIAAFMQTDEQAPQPRHSAGSTRATSPRGPAFTIVIALLGHTLAHAPQCMQTRSFTRAVYGFATPDSTASLRMSLTASETLTSWGQTSSQRLQPEHNHMNSECMSPAGLATTAL